MVVDSLDIPTLLQSHIPSLRHGTLFNYKLVLPLMHQHLLFFFHPYSAHPAYRFLSASSDSVIGFPTSPLSYSQHSLLPKFFDYKPWFYSQQASQSNFPWIGCRTVGPQFSTHLGSFSSFLPSIFLLRCCLGAFGSRTTT